jgi:hypothetical protein
MVVRWADLLRRVFEIDVLNCVRCGGRLRFLSAIAGECQTSLGPDGPMVPRPDAR